MNTGNQKICCLDSDEYWGVTGKNMSGQLLELIRHEFKMNNSNE